MVNPFLADELDTTLLRPGTVERIRIARSSICRGFQISRMIRLATDLGIAERIAPEGHLTSVNWRQGAPLPVNPCFAFSERPQS